MEFVYDQEKGGGSLGRSWSFYHEDTKLLIEILLLLLLLVFSLVQLTLRTRKIDVDSEPQTKKYILFFISL